MKKRSLGMMILLTVVTAGLYELYWLVKFQMELKEKTGEGFGGLGHFLMIIFTFGIYAIYWQYAAGKRLAKAGAEDHAIIYLILTFVALGWLTPFMMQNQANKIA